MGRSGSKTFKGIYFLLFLNYVKALPIQKDSKTVHFITHSFIWHLKQTWGQSGREISLSLTITTITYFQRQLCKRNTKNFINFRWLSLSHIGKTTQHNLETQWNLTTAKIAATKKKKKSNCSFVGYVLGAAYFVKLNIYNFIYSFK